MSGTLLVSQFLICFFVRISINTIELRKHLWGENATAFYQGCVASKLIFVENKLELLRIVNRKKPFSLERRKQQYPLLP